MNGIGTWLILLFLLTIVILFFYYTSSHNLESFVTTPLSVASGSIPLTNSISLTFTGASNNIGYINYPPSSSSSSSGSMGTLCITTTNNKEGTITLVLNNPYIQSVVLVGGGGSSTADVNDNIFMGQIGSQTSFVPQGNTPFVVRIGSGGIYYGGTGNSGGNTTCASYIANGGNTTRTKIQWNYISVNSYDIVTIPNNVSGYKTMDNVDTGIGAGAYNNNNNQSNGNPGGIVIIYSLTPKSSSVPVSEFPYMSPSKSPSLQSKAWRRVGVWSSRPFIPLDTSQYSNQPYCYVMNALQNSEVKDDEVIRNFYQKYMRNGTKPFASFMSDGQNRMDPEMSNDLVSLANHYREYGFYMGINVMCVGIEPYTLSSSQLSCYAQQPTNNVSVSQALNDWKVQGFIQNKSFKCLYPNTTTKPTINPTTPNPTTPNPTIKPTPRNLTYTAYPYFDAPNIVHYDYRDVSNNATGIQVCKDFCNSSASCVSFDTKAQSDTTRTCWFKTENPSAGLTFNKYGIVHYTNNTGTIKYMDYDVTTNYYGLGNIDFPGNDMTGSNNLESVVITQSTPNQRINVCAQICDNTPGSAGFEWVPENNWCYVKSTMNVDARTGTSIGLPNIQAYVKKSSPFKHYIITNASSNLQVIDNGSNIEITSNNGGIATGTITFVTPYNVAKIELLGGGGGGGGGGGSAWYNCCSDYNEYMGGGLAGGGGGQGGKTTLTNRAFTPFNGGYSFQIGGGGSGGSGGRGGRDKENNRNGGDASLPGGDGADGSDTWMYGIATSYGGKGGKGGNGVGTDKNTTQAGVKGGQGGHGDYSTGGDTTGVNGADGGSLTYNRRDTGPSVSVTGGWDGIPSAYSYGGWSGKGGYTTKNSGQPGTAGDNGNNGAHGCIRFTW